MKITINKKKYEAQEGETVLDVCRRENIAIPTLCAHGKLKREAACRLCLVEVNLTDKLVPSCVFPVCEKLEVVTQSERIEKARKINLELLWSDHAGKCASCKKNRMCELQKLAEDYKIDNFHFVPKKEDLTNMEELDILKDNRLRVVVEDKNLAISRTTEFCVECRRCVNVCPDKVLGFNNRAGDVVVGTPYEKVLDCSFCGECVRVCPTAALTDQNDYGKINEDLDNIKKLAVAVVGVGMEEKMMEQLKKMSKKDDLKKLLSALGFEKIMSMEKKYDEDELIKSIKTDLARKEKISHENIVVFFITDKIARKVSKSESFDYVLTEREIARLARDKKII